MARVGAEHYQHSQTLPYAREMDFTGKALQGMAYVDPAGIGGDSELVAWLQRGHPSAPWLNAPHRRATELIPSDYRLNL